MQAQSHTLIHTYTHSVNTLPMIDVASTSFEPVTKHSEAVQADDTTVLPTQNVRREVSVLDHSCPQ